MWANKNRQVRTVHKATEFKGRRSEQEEADTPRGGGVKVSCERERCLACLAVFAKDVVIDD